MEKKGYLEMSVECKLALLKVINLLFVKIILINSFETFQGRGKKTLVDTEARYSGNFPPKIPLVISTQVLSKKNLWKINFYIHQIQKNVNYMNVSHCNGKSGLIEESLAIFFYGHFATGITELF